MTSVDLVKAVAGFWPSYRMTPLMADNILPSLRAFSQPDITYALARHFAERPDETRPEWKAIIADLKRLGDGSVTGTSPVDMLLRQMRDRLMKCGRRDAVNWSDDKVFRRLMAAEIEYAISEPFSRPLAPRRDLTERHVKDARSQAREVIRQWMNECHASHVPPPPWLLEREAPGMVNEMWREYFSGFQVGPWTEPPSAKEELSF